MRLFIRLSWIFSAFWLSVLTLSVGAADNGKINQDWLNRDVALITKTKVALGPSYANGGDIDDFLKVLSPSVREERALGCGIRQVSMALYGGYTSIWINVAVVDKKIVALECKQSDSGSIANRIAPDLLKAWGSVPIKKVDDYIRVTSYVDRHIVDSVTEREFGSVKIASSPDALDEPFALLMSPLEQTDVGEGCYDGGEKPAGRTAIEKLVEAGRYDLIRAVLRGPSPEARAYAALMLNREKKASPDDLAVEDKLRKLNVPIHVCHGCIVSTESFDQVMLEKRYDPSPRASSKSRAF